MATDTGGLITGQTQQKTPQQRIAELEEALAAMTADRDTWKERAEAWKARWEHDSTDAYNARINEALRSTQN